MKAHFDPSLYLIADTQFMQGRDLVAAVMHAVRGGVTLVQLRAKGAVPTEVRDLARRLMRELQLTSTPLLINDDVEMAKEIGAAGAHIGLDDMRPDRARRILGPKAILGVSLETDRAWSSEDLKRVDYVAASPVFATSSKSDAARPFGVEGLVTLRKVYSLPLIAIGGITPKNARSLLMAGADGLAVISAILGAEDPQRAAREFATQIGEFRK